MKCSRCEHENLPGAKSCVGCGASLGAPFDAERIRAQLRKWQERLLDLTKANPLLGINRSRVSKLRIVDPDPAEIVSNVVDSLVDRGSLRVSGPNVYLA